MSETRCDCFFLKSTGKGRWEVVHSVRCPKSAYQQLKLRQGFAAIQEPEVERQILDLEAEITRLKAELAKERECVDWYANGDSWFYPGDDYSNFLVAKTDMSRTQRGTNKGALEDIVCGGKRARARQAERGKE